MLTLLEQLDKGTLWHSPGGVHPPGLKATSSSQAIQRLPLAKEFIIPIPQVGDMATLTVKLNDNVLKGQMLTTGKGFTYLPVHAPTSGRVKAIEKRSSNHASGLPVLCCVIEPDGKDQWTPLQGNDASLLSNEAIIDKIRSAGIAGMGGAAFPTHIKLNPASDINLVILNGVECEPFITADDRLMREHADEIIQGVKIIHQLLSPQRVVIAIEDNKPEAIVAMQKAIASITLDNCQMRVTVIPTKYPSGGAKQLIQIITGQEVPSGRRSAQLGVLVHNVGTAYAIQDAIIHGKPLIERVVTLTGEQVGQPGNYWLPIGTPIKHALQHTKFHAQTQQKMIIGGPMMGYALSELQVPVLKGTNCILAPSNNEIAPDMPEQACIRCGECAVACPVLLLPQQLFWHSKAEEFDKAASYNLQDCIECGCCSYVCPSDIPLVEYFRIAKSALKNIANEQKQAKQAKLRFEARLKRLDDEKQAREVKSKAAADKRKQSMSTNDKDAVALAMARIAAKKKANATEAQPSNSLSPASSAKKATVNAAIERAKAKKAAKAAQTDTRVAPQTATNTLEKTANKANADINADLVEQDPKKARIAAAVARAKAKKATQASSPALTDTSSNHAQSSANTENNSIVDNAANEAVASKIEDDPKKARIAAAVARAKAKKAAQTNSPATTHSSNSHAQSIADTKNDSIVDYTVNEAVTSKLEDDPKKARIAAAVAKAKAKKGALNSSSQPTTSVPSELESTSSKLTVDQTATISSNNTNQLTVNAEPDDKKARIATAVAKAKAKKLAQQQQKD